MVTIAGISIYVSENLFYEFMISTFFIKFLVINYGSLF